MLGVWRFIKEYGLGKKIGESIKKFKERKLRKVKYEFSDDVDGIIIFEGDVILDVEPEEFVSSIIKSYKFL